MSFKVIRRFALVKDHPGHYYSFPTAVVSSSGVVLVSYRDASFDEDTLSSDYNGHGENGDMYILGWDVTREKRACHYKVYDHCTTGENEQNTILSSPGGNDIYLFSRQHGKASGVFFAYSTDDGKSFLGRNEVVLDEFEFLACYGKVRTFDDILVAPVYGVRSDYESDDRRCGAAWIYSDKSNFHWKFGGWISPPISGGPSFNETALIMKDGRGLALLRSGEGSEALFSSSSTERLAGWSRPDEVGFRGEAPELHDLGRGRIALSYRGFMDNGHFCWAMRISEDFGKSWGDRYLLSEYQGSRYHGGYGDIVHLNGDMWMGVFYGPGSSGLPGISAVIFTI